MRLGEGGAQRLIEPVGVESLLDQLEAVVVNLALVLVDDFAVRIEVVVTRSITSGKLLVGELLACVHHVIVRQVRPCHLVVAAVGEAQLTRLGLHRLDYHNAVGCLRTVDGGGGGILQDGDACHAVDVEVGDGRQVALETVEDEERLVGVIFVVRLQVGQVRRTADADVQRGVRVRTAEVVVRDDERRVECLEALEHVQVSDLLEFLVRVGRHGAGEALGISGVDTRHDGFLQVDRVRLQADGNVLGNALHTHGLRLHADVGEHEVVYALGDRDFKTSVDVGSHARAFAVGERHADARQRGIGVVDDYAPVNDFLLRCLALRCLLFTSSRGSLRHRGKR